MGGEHGFLIGESLLGSGRTDWRYVVETIAKHDAADSDPASVSGDGSDAADQTTSTADSTSWHEAYKV